MANIKQIKLSESNIYDIEALHFFAQSNLDTPAQWKSYIDDIAASASKIQIVIDPKSSSGEYPATPASDSTLGKIYLVILGSEQSGTYTEFITVDKGAGASPRYVWEKIGTTSTDLTEYAKKSEAALAGSYTTGGSGTLTTNANSAVTLTTTEQAAYSAVGSTEGISFNLNPYDISSKLNYDTTQNTSVSTSSNTGNASITVNLGDSAFSFSGTKATLTGSVTVSGQKVTVVNEPIEKVYLPPISDNSTLTYLYLGKLPSSSFTQGSFTQGSKASFTQGSKASLVYTTTTDTNSVMRAPTVSSDGVLSWTLATISGASKISSWQANGNDTFTPNGNDTFTKPVLTFSAGILPSFVTGASVYEGESLLGNEVKQFISLVYASSFTLGDSGIGNTTKFDKGYYTPSYNVTSVTPSFSITYTPSGSLSGSKTYTHSHTYNAPVAHTHDVIEKQLTITPYVTLNLGTFDVSVAIPKHSHQVTISGHTHTINSHTHNVTISPIEGE